jgi:hypothetical protein
VSASGQSLGEVRGALAVAEDVDEIGVLSGAEAWISRRARIFEEPLAEAVAGI